MDFIMWLLVGIFIYLAIGVIFIYLTGAYEGGFWEQVSAMLLWPVLVIIFSICCIYFGCEEMYKRVKKYVSKQ